MILVDMEGNLKNLQGISDSINKNFKFIEKLIADRAPVTRSSSSESISTSCSQCTDKEDTTVDIDDVSATDFTEASGTKKTRRKKGNIQTVGDICISNANNIHIGNVSYITRNVNIVQTEGGNIGEIKQANTSSNDDAKFKTNPLSKDALRISNKKNFIITTDTEKLVKISYVIISQADESVLAQEGSSNESTKAQNNTRQKYNFLIDKDGCVHEERGWEISDKTGDKKSITIVFIGDFAKVLPSEISLNTCKYILKKGIKLGYLKKKYKLIDGNDSKSTNNQESALLNELRKWNTSTEKP